MNITELRDALIEKGIKSAKSKETGAKLEGALKGFELCRTLDSMEDFERVLQEREIEEDNLRIAVHKDSEGKEAIDNYWSYRYGTLQVEFVYETLKVGFPGRYKTISARAGMRYAGIVGVKKD